MRRGLLQWLATWLYPARCQGCGRLGPEPLCAACAAQVPLMLLPRCRWCGHWFDPLARDVERCPDCRAARARDLLVARTAAAHEGLTRRLVVRLKYQRHQAAAEALAVVLSRWLRHDEEAVCALALERATALVPVPLHRRREWWRSFNQARLLAQALAQEWGLPLAEALVRVRSTRPQVGLNPQARERNVKGAFAAVAEHIVPGGTYVLVDDVYTSGATLRECARTLLRAGAAEVVALTVARPLRADLLQLARRLSAEMDRPTDGEGRAL